MGLVLRRVSYNSGAYEHWVALQRESLGSSSLVCVGTGYPERTRAISFISPWALVTEPEHGEGLDRDI